MKITLVEANRVYDATTTEAARIYREATEAFEKALADANRIYDAATAPHVVGR